MTICAIHITTHVRAFTVRNAVSSLLAVVHAVAKVKDGVAFSGNPDLVLA